MAPAPACFLFLFTPLITFFPMYMNVLPDLQSTKRGALCGFVIGGLECIVSVFSSFWRILQFDLSFKSSFTKFDRGKMGKVKGKPKDLCQSMILVLVKIHQRKHI